MTRVSFAVTAAVALSLASPVSPWLKAQDAGMSQAAKTELDQGQLALDHRQYFQALQRLTRANQLAGNRCAECLVSMAEAMLGMKSHQNALDTGAQALEAADGNAHWISRAHLVRAEAYQGLAETDASKYRDAEAELRAAIAADPRSRGTEEIRYTLGVVLLKQGRDDEGIAELKRVADARPDAVGDDARALIANPRRARENVAPEFNIVTADNQRITLASLHGKVVLLDFWATSSPLSVKAVPSLKKFQAAHAHDPLVIISVSSDQDDGVWRRFTVKNEMTWPQYWDKTSAFPEPFEIKTLPTYIVIDGDGIERFRVSGTPFQDSRALSNAIDKALATLKSAP